MGKQIRITVEGGYEMIADMLEDLAPKTCQQLWDSLPIEDEMLQVKWSGNVIYVFSKIDLSEAECSRCHGVCIGDMLYNPHVHDAAEHPHEIAFVYGPASMATVSGYAISNLFARIQPKYLEQLSKLGDEISTKGLKIAKIERV